MPPSLVLHDSGLLKDKVLVNGQWQNAHNHAQFNVNNPATGKLIAVVPNMGAAETALAIEHAHVAFLLWKQYTAKQRASYLQRWFALMLAHQNDLATILTAEQGKPFQKSLNEVIYAASFIEWFAEEGKRAYGDIIPSSHTGKRMLTIKEPIGVAAIITPWNFPLAMITRKVAPALAAGCTVVIKPASETPLCALALAELAQRAGIPPGVINMVTGDPHKIGAELTHNPLVRKLSFTGSTRTGKQLIHQCADTVKKMSMELGGNAPLIVFEDADLNEAVAGTLASKFRNTGQTCICANRILVHETLCEAFAQKLQYAVERMVVGNGLKGLTHQGPLISRAAQERMGTLVTDALALGATLLTGGRAHPAGDHFYTPTILTNVTPAMRCAREEIFGPIAPLLTFKTEAEAIRIANDTPFGLAAYFYSRDLQRIWRVAEALECGMIGINDTAISTEVAPFGGIKESGFGREGSRYGLEEYLQIKYLCMGNTT